MGQRCDISELLGDGHCPVCTTARAPAIHLDAWDELRAVTTGAEPEPLVLRIGA